MKVEIAETVAVLLFAYELCWRSLSKRDAVVWFAFLAGWVGFEFLATGRRGMAALLVALLISACYLIRLRQRQRNPPQGTV
jgi:hypothetical protein